MAVDCVGVVVVSVTLSLCVSNGTACMIASVAARGAWRARMWICDKGIFFGPAAYCRQKIV